MPRAGPGPGRAALLRVVRLIAGVFCSMDPLFVEGEVIELETVTVGRSQDPDRDTREKNLPSR